MYETNYQMSYSECSYIENYANELITHYGRIPSDVGELYDAIKSFDSETDFRRKEDRAYFNYLELDMERRLEND